MIRCALMIAVTLMGGLGNQMFQYAAGRALALRHGTDLVVDVGFLERPPPQLATVRRFELDCFRIEARIVHRVRSSEPPAPGVGLRGSLAARSRQLTSRFSVLRQRGLEFAPAFFAAPDFTHLVGYWQSERYFENAVPTLRDEFRFADELTGQDAALLERIREAPSVSVHVRRGDYVANPASAAFHGLLGRGYYVSALDEVQRRVGEVHAFVFSDDPAWCRQHLGLGVPATIVDHNRSRGCSDMRLLASCRHHVIANSSFSWWGAWLGEADDSVVVAPRRWVADTAVDVSHVVPVRWLSL